MKPEKWWSFTILVILALALFGALTIIRVGLGMFAAANDESGRAAIRELVPVLDSMKSKTGQYPKSIEGIKTAHGPKPRVLGFLPGPKLLYSQTATGYRVQYYSWPFGPYEGYDSNSRQWFAEE